ncbi:hypothetical protein XELAEV_18047748mg [Xenopus laevis]|uniref:Uncharacterized protein n=1 Tax=Xenopus laevis TaxID=8355 RepID=A0A974BV93_XENLA|nr:hypothetical protein XELAEV_18047748mg [Xenopus laevis]
MGTCASPFNCAVRRCLHTSLPDIHSVTCSYVSAGGKIHLIPARGMLGVAVTRPRDANQWKATRTTELGPPLDRQEPHRRSSIGRSASGKMRQRSDVSLCR